MRSRGEPEAREARARDVEVEVGSRNLPRRGRCRHLLGGYSRSGTVREGASGRRQFSLRLAERTYVDRAPGPPLHLPFGISEDLHAGAIGNGAVRNGKWVWSVRKVERLGA